jgi:hypothetical protein
LPDIFSLRRPNNHPTMFESYLNLIQRNVDKDRCAFYSVNENQVTRSREKEHSRYQLVLLHTYPKRWKTLKGIVEEIRGKMEPGGEIHIIIAPQESQLLNLGRIGTWLFMKRILRKCKFSQIETYGIFPSARSPKLFVPFKKNVYQFVLTKYFRYNDYPLKHMIKQIMVSYLGAVFWRGDFVLVGKHG